MNPKNLLTQTLVYWCTLIEFCIIGFGTDYIWSVSKPLYIILLLNLLAGILMCKLTIKNLDIVSGYALFRNLLGPKNLIAFYFNCYRHDYFISRLRCDNGNALCNVATVMVRVRSFYKLQMVQEY